MAHPDGPDESDDLLQVGRITKAHGLRGEVVVYLVSDRQERVAAGSVLQSPIGPLTVQASRRHQDRWIVQFESVEGREQADALRGTELSAVPLPNDGDLWVHELIGRHVVDVHGVERGTIESVMDNPASDLLVLDTGALVPVAFVVGEPGDDPIRVDTPEGLFELFD